jgi:hypothetical protein
MGIQLVDRSEYWPKVGGLGHELPKLQSPSRLKATDGQRIVVSGQNDKRVEGDGDISLVSFAIKNSPFLRTNGCDRVDISTCHVDADWGTVSITMPSEARADEVGLCMPPGLEGRGVYCECWPRARGKLLASMGE